MPLGWNRRPRTVFSAIITNYNNIHLYSSSHHKVIYKLCTFNTTEIQPTLALKETTKQLIACSHILWINFLSPHCRRIRGSTQSKKSYGIISVHSEQAGSLLLRSHLKDYLTISAFTDIQINVPCWDLNLWFQGV